LACLAQSTPDVARSPSATESAGFFGGEDPRQDFDVTRFRLNPGRLKYGLGREKFPALIEPEFVSAGEASQLTASKPAIYVLSVCRRASMLRGNAQRLAAADRVSLDR
jgi:hypothetical protein